MNLPKKSRSLRSTSTSSQKKMIVDKPEPEDQNLVDGTVSDGGIVIQGRGARVKITQIIGSQTSGEAVKSPDAQKIIAVQYFEPETILIPKGKFLMGSAAGEGIPEYETPQHEIDLPSYRIGKYPVKNAEYEEFIIQKKLLVSPAMNWDGQRAPKGRGDYPVTGVTWYEALAYCEWLSKETSRSYSLPNEAQWEKACRGGMNTLYPWGDEFDHQRCNYGRPDLAPVDAYPAQSEYGFDFVGNVYQWTCTLWGEDRFTPDSRYPYNRWREDGRNNLEASRQIRRVMRGSIMNGDIKLLRCSARSGHLPKGPLQSDMQYGFRVAMSVSSFKE